MEASYLLCVHGYGKVSCVQVLQLSSEGGGQELQLCMYVCLCIHVHTHVEGDGTVLYDLSLLSDVHAHGKELIGQTMYCSVCLWS